MAMKRKASAKITKTPVVEFSQEPVVEEKPVNPQFVTQVVEEVPAASLSDMPVNEGVDVSEEALETIKENAVKIEEVVEEIEEEKKVKENSPRAADLDGPEDGETIPVEETVGKKALEEKKEEDKVVLSELFTKEAPSAVDSDSSENKPLGAAPVFLWAVIIIGIALLTGGTLLVVASGLPKVPSMFAKPTPTSTPTSTPIPTPKVPVQSDITVEVLNGGGTPGSAGKAKTFLEGKGYTVSNLGNTDEYTYKKTEIHVKPGKEAYLELLKNDVAEDYVLGTSSADLSADSSYDAQVIVGKE